MGADREVHSAPHPSEEKIHLRIQMYGPSLPSLPIPRAQAHVYLCMIDGKSSLVALHTALDNLENMTDSILSAYEASVAEGDYDRPVDLAYDFESVNDRLWAEKEASGRGNREEFEKAKREKEELEREKDIKPLKKAGKVKK